MHRSWKARSGMERRSAWLAAGVWLACMGGVAAGDTFEQEVAPILVRRCLQCHNASDLKGNLDLGTAKGLRAGGESGPVLVAGKPEESLLVQRVREGSMPPEEQGMPLSAAEVEHLATWVAAGADWPAERELSLYEQSTDQRAGWDWWSLRPVQPVAVPKIEEPTGNEIDPFLRSKLNEVGLGYAPPASKRVWLRRVTLDLIGLPPTPEEMAAFLADESPGAFAVVAERLLASPHYGERWGRHWLDVVRFSESKGFERDRIREHAWRYRDWVIQALNDDMPYDEFVRRQIAGDLLAPQDAAAAVATGFLVTGANNDVGNGSPLELARERMDELDDFVGNVSSAMLGLTVTCARCHDHKFDPIPTRDYYRLAAALAGVKYGDRPLATAEAIAARESRAKAIEAQLKSLNEELTALEARRGELTGGTVVPTRNEVVFEPISARFIRMTIVRTEGGDAPCIDELEVYGDEGTKNWGLASEGAKATASSLLPGFSIHQVAHLNDGAAGNDHSWISNELGRGWAQLELPQPVTIAHVVWGRDRTGQFKDRTPVQFSWSISLDGADWTEILPKQRAGLSEVELQELARIEGEHTERVARQTALRAEQAELPQFEMTWGAVATEVKPVHVLHRGDVLTPREEATPAGLSAVRNLPGEFNPQSARVALAHWIARAENPLTARVIVNRVWHYHFGQGIVDTPSDLGFNGGRPSHPELLDWLAGWFVQHGWSLKSLHRLIVLSGAYRQGWRDDTKGSEVDAANRWLWRMNRRRLEAETIRDSILATSGTLEPKLGGPSWRSFMYTDGNIPVYEELEAEGPETWRRAVYRHAVRSHSLPFLDVFDCPDSSVMAPTRPLTTTPLQALSLLNNRFVVEQARHLADRLERDRPGDRAAQAGRGFELVLGRAAEGTETARAVVFIEAHGLAAWARVLWNTNEFLYVE